MTEHRLLPVRDIYERGRRDLPETGHWSPHFYTAASVANCTLTSLHLSPLEMRLTAPLIPLRAKVVSKSATVNTTAPELRDSRSVVVISDCSVYMDTT